MAQNDKIQSSSEPSLGMKVVLSTVRSRFSKVKQLSTKQLHLWSTENHQNSTGDQSPTTTTTTGDLSTITGVSGSDGPYTVSQEYLKNRQMIVLDTRPEEEFVVSHLQGAIRVNPDIDIPGLIKTMPFLDPKETLSAGRTTIVCYCSLGYRSSTVAQKLQDYLRQQKDLYSNIEIYNLEGSLFKWANEGLPMVDGDDRSTIFAHPFSVIWGKLLHSHLRRDKPL